MFLFQYWGHQVIILSFSQQTVLSLPLRLDIKGRKTIPQLAAKSSQSQNTPASEPSLALWRSLLWAAEQTMFSLTLPVIVQWPFSTLRGNFRLIRLENVSFPFPSPSNVPCHDLGHMLGVLHHLRRFLSKTTLIPNGPISLHLHLYSAFLLFPTDSTGLSRALTRLSFCTALLWHAEPEPLSRLQCPVGGSCGVCWSGWVHTLLRGSFTCLGMELGSCWAAV